MLIVQVSDLLVHNSAIEVVDAAVRQVKDALLRQIDNALQTTVTGGTNGVNYSGAKSARANLATGDVFTTTDYNKAIRNLRQVSSAGLAPFEGNYYAVVMHPNQEYDLRSNSSSGSWLDLGRYTSVNELKAGKVGDFLGGRVLSSANVQSFSSTVTVYPAMFLGRESFGWGYFSPLTPQMVSTPDSNNALNLYTSIGAKATMGSARFNDGANTYRIVRVESAVSA